MSCLRAPPDAATGNRDQSPRRAGTTVEVARDAGGLQPHLAAWHGLVKRSLAPNVFYEPGPLLAALENRLRDEPFAIALVYRGDAGDGADGTGLIGLFPFYRARGGPFGALGYYRLFTHFHCYLPTPLIDRDAADMAIDGLLDWIDTRPDGTGLFHFGEVAADGALAAAWRARLAARGQPHRFYHRVSRAVFRPASDADAYFDAALSGKRRKEYRRQYKRLAELGEVAVAVAWTLDDPARWVDDFVALEAKGWKGPAGTALAAAANHRRYFAQLVEGANAAGRLMVLSLALDGRPVAMKCNVLADGGEGGGGGSFALKIAYDDAYAKYSPGVLLEIENIRALHEAGARVRWMDSCAVPDHPMIDRLWRDRLPIVNLVCGSHGLLNRAGFRMLGLWKSRDGG